LEVALVKKRLTIAVVLMFVVLVYTIKSLVFPYPESHHIADFKYLKQPDGITCGPTSATMVLNRYGKDVTLDEVKAKTKTQWLKYKGKSIGMTSPEYIAVALRHFGVSAKQRRGYVRRLKHYVGRNHPCVVLLRSGEYTWHYVVVIGYDEERIYVADPGSGRREMKIEHFEGAWKFETNMRGEPLESGWLNTVLRVAEVYPYTMTIPKHPL
jgi:ABC-type bacteriocin/lantibiotic exporter with double-glycine peptidase domain